MCRFFASVAGLIGCLIVALPVAGNEAEDINRLVCGPRCVAYILEQTGQKGNLLGIIQEIQWPDTEQGTSLAQIEKYLIQRGVQTKWVALSPGERPAIEGLAVVAIERDNELGHFVVVTESSRQSGVQYFDGLQGMQSTAFDDFWNQCYSTILLAGPSPPQEAISAYTRGFSLLSTAVAGALVGFMVYFGSFFPRFIKERLQC